MSIKALSVGQCSFDHGAISKLLLDVGAQAIKVDLHADTTNAIKEHSPSLILINRINDSDGTSGIELIKELRANAAFAGIPVMLVSNYEDAQRDAVAAGAVKGFGKSSMNSEDTRKRLKEALRS